MFARVCSSTSSQSANGILSCLFQSKFLSTHVAAYMNLWGALQDQTYNSEVIPIHPDIRPYVPVLNMNSGICVGYDIFHTLILLMP